MVFWSSRTCSLEDNDKEFKNGHQYELKSFIYEAISECEIVFSLLTVLALLFNACEYQHIFLLVTPSQAADIELS